MDGPSSLSFQAAYDHSSQPEDDPPSAVKGVKRKRLAKACQQCHRSKRRCDSDGPGSSVPCSNCKFSGRNCTFSDSSRAAQSPSSAKQDASKQPRQASARGKVEQEPESGRRRVKNTSIRPQSVVPLPGRGLGLENALTQELTNLFFAHCHPVRAIFHKPSFWTALTHNGLPSYLLLAIYSLAAPLSRQQRFRSPATGPPRLSGRPFVQEAASQMFDASGHLICEANLFTAQALCLLLAHDIACKAATEPPDVRYRDLALQVVQALGAHNPEPPAGAGPSADSIQASIDRECGRRIFWVIHAMELACSIFAQRPVSLSETQLRLRLPVDETSFELAVQYPAPEYLYSSTRAQSTSELGHFIRILSLYTEAEHLLTRPDINLAELEKRGEEWTANLPENLRFSEPNLEVQQSMFETSSNTAPWCFFFMHTVHVGLLLALHAGQSDTTSSVQPQWAISRLDLIVRMLGDRAKNTTLMGVILWIQIRYCHRDDPHIRSLCNKYEEICGLRLFDLAAPLIARPTEPMYPRLLSTSTPSQTFSLGRSLDELRLPTQTNNWPYSPSPDREELSRRLQRDLDADLPHRNSRLGESLPSLKSSGLLDSWNSTIASNSRPMKAPPDRASLSSSMPVGLPWLAHETR
ncbi:Coatomer protein [Mycena chlorophos]|uniref:Coatomer protein n=1 Tax=Mycena chlorophos TaxID=658473 RepID=A0A8H6T391_MYCCL|nr:Coatomer protein [Mycena chlorophos]